MTTRDDVETPRAFASGEDIALTAMSHERAAQLDCKALEVAEADDVGRVSPSPTACGITRSALASLLALHLSR